MKAFPECRRRGGNARFNRISTKAAGKESCRNDKIMHQ
jgi:hypothetical protein